MQSIILMLQHFINREHELEFLNWKYAGNSPQRVVLYGRKRVGEAELVKRCDGTPNRSRATGYNY